MYIDKFKIVKDNETVAVMLVGVNQKTGEETLKPVAYTRDVLDALQAVKRKMSVDSLKANDLSDAIAILEQQHQDIMDLVKSKCKECLT